MSGPARVVVTNEHRYCRLPDGTVWGSFFNYPFWQRYLDVFDEVRVVARVRDVISLSDSWRRADGPGVSIAAIPYYIGPWQYLLRARRVSSVARAAVGPSDAVVLRVDSQMAACIEPVLRRQGRPYGVEVVVDPYDVFAPGSMEHPLRGFFRWWFVRQLRQQCSGAAAAAYVTERALQRRYPPAVGAFTTHYSSVELPPEAFVSAGRSAPRPGDQVRLVMVGTLDNLRKGPDILIDAVANCVRAGIDLCLTFVGDGRYRASLQQRAGRSGLAGRVHFAGEVASGGPVREFLDRADLFVLPSYGEGLPRSALEAMARGLPVIGSKIGGFEELLQPEDLVPTGDREALTSKIREVAGDPERLERMSRRNLQTAFDYRDEILQERRVAFYQALKRITEEWAGSRPF